MAATMRSPISTVPTEPPPPAISAVRIPPSSVCSTASSTAAASSVSPSEYRSIMAMLRMDPMGLAMPFPAMSGAVPWIGSYIPTDGCPSTGTPARLADGSIPIDAPSTDASSVRMSPKVFSATITSK